MVSALALLFALVLTLCAVAVIYRASRRLLTVGRPNDVTVSRQWLLQHQDES
jgi:hypothetical protein